MATWLYQINQQLWRPERYRLEIWENERWFWPVGRTTGGGEPTAGDSVVFFYAPSGGTDAGFYGWAVVLEWLDEQKAFYFRPVSPSDRLKMCPWWDKQASNLADRIRGKVKQGTLWRVPEKLVTDLRRGINVWCGGETSPDQALQRTGRAVLRR